MTRTRTVGYTSATAAPSRRGPVLALVILVLLMAVGAVSWVAGRASAPDSQESQPAAGVGAPSIGTGPGPVAPLVPTPAVSGFPNTPDGAGDAAASYLRTHYLLVTAPVEQGEQFLTRIAAPGALEALKTKLGTRGPLNGSSGNTINQFIGVRIINVADPDGTVRVLVWGAGMLATKTDAVTSTTPPVLRWTTTVLRMTWVDNQWKVVDVVSDTPGPTPPAMGQPDPAEKFAQILGATGRPADGP